MKTVYMERCPSGQREQTVNLPAHAFEGSNPSLSTIKQERLWAGIAQLARARAFQARGRGFESRFPLQYFVRGNGASLQFFWYFIGQAIHSVGCDSEKTDHNAQVAQ